MCSKIDHAYVFSWCFFIELESWLSSYLVAFYFVLAWCYLHGLGVFGTRSTQWFPLEVSCMFEIYYWNSWDLRPNKVVERNISEMVWNLDQVHTCSYNLVTFYLFNLHFSMFLTLFYLHNLMIALNYLSWEWSRMSFSLINMRVWQIGCVVQVNIYQLVKHHVLMSFRRSLY